MDIMNMPGNFHWSDRRRLKVKSRMREDFPPVLLFQPPAPHDVPELTKTKPDIAGTALCA